jgi:hypothetical protein
VYAVATDQNRNLLDPFKRDHRDVYHAAALLLRHSPEGLVTATYTDEALGGEDWEATTSATMHWLVGSRQDSNASARVILSKSVTDAQVVKKWATVKNALTSRGETHHGIVLARCVKAMCSSLRVSFHLDTTPGLQARTGFVCCAASVTGQLIRPIGARAFTMLLKELTKHPDFQLMRSPKGMADRAPGTLLTRLVQRYVQREFPDAETHAAEWEHVSCRGTVADWCVVCDTCGLSDRADVLQLGTVPVHTFCLPAGGSDAAGRSSSSV